MNGWLRPVGDQRSQTVKKLMILVQASNAAIILNAEIDFPALTIRHAHHGLDQIAIRQAFAVALEFAGQGFLGGNGDWRRLHDG